MDVDVWGCLAVIIKDDVQFERGMRKAVVDDTDGRPPAEDTLKGKPTRTEVVEGPLI